MAKKNDSFEKLKQMVGWSITFYEVAGQWVVWMPANLGEGTDLSLFFDNDPHEAIDKAFCYIQNKHKLETS